MQDDGRYDLLVDEPIVPRITDDEEADIRDCVDRCLRVFERYISEYRDQWYVFRPIWRETNSARATRTDRLRERQIRVRDRLRARAERRRRSER
jgi:lauroyl/myristoyl acyltransferase